MKSISKFSLTLFSLLALSGISASASQKDNNTTTNSNKESVANQSQSNSNNQTNVNNQQSDVQGNSLKDNSSNITIINKTDYNSQSKKVNQLTESQKNSSNSPTNNVRKKHHIHVPYYSNHTKYSMSKGAFTKSSIKNVHKHYHKIVMYRGKKVPTWFIDGLSHKQLRARGWIVHRESGGHWRVLSYGHVCVGRYQLNPGYLGYKHGHVNLGHRHQTIVADRYVRNRYGSWVFAKRFWRSHHWY